MGAYIDDETQCPRCNCTKCVEVLDNDLAYKSIMCPECGLVCFAERKFIPVISYIDESIKGQDLMDDKYTCDLYDELVSKSDGEEEKENILGDQEV
jgi:uncharacterized Zn finger protein